MSEIDKVAKEKPYLVHAWRITPYVCLGLIVKPGLFRRVLYPILLGWKYELVRSEKSYWGMSVDTTKDDDIFNKGGAK